jgi:hypothetical protein
MAEKDNARDTGPCSQCGKVRGEIFTNLDRLAFALEMEAADHIGRGDEDRARRLELQRLGVRLAQRLVSDVWADEVHARLDRWQTEYEARLNPAEKVEAG